jgi:hypothetical protein
VGGTTGLEPNWCYGCTDGQAINFNPEATIDDYSCEYNETITYSGSYYTCRDDIFDDIPESWTVFFSLSTDVDIGQMQVDFEAANILTIAFPELPQLSPVFLDSGSVTFSDTSGTIVLPGTSTTLEATIQLLQPIPPFFPVQIQFVFWDTSDNEIATFILNESLIEYDAGCMCALDDCGVCGGGNVDLDCAGVCFGGAFENECGCVGGYTGLEPDWCYGCTDPAAVNYNPDSIIDNDSCLYCTPGDLTTDDVVDVLDVVQLVAIVLGNWTPNETESCAANLNSDEVLDVLDIVLLVELILGE